ncbi:MAG: TetR/AcrR family transcriptional regulator [Alloalcanivorax venustensis]|uniref:TetR/AcrR family transcriptional regulator n=1 Tax=Alloalcanivorax venustensis TaxID=172371 RepID=UPI002E998B19|nr:TetR/AcrR family transcriptional regulator [Pseudomonadota bacterium]
MGARPKHRDRLVRAAAELFRQRGYAATGINDILGLAAAPKGSFYHYFPGGKEALGAEAVRYAGDRVTDTLQTLERDHRTPAAALRAYGALLAGWLKDSDYRDGCPLATTVLEVTPQSEPITAAAREAYAAWRRTLATLIDPDNTDGARAQRLASLAISALEGALIQARVSRDPAPIHDACEEIAALIDALQDTV